MDGDADRLLMVDAKGNTFDGDQLVLHHRLAPRREGQLGGGVVGTR